MLHLNDPTKGINRVSFLEYYDYPGLIGERFRRVFDVDDVGYILEVPFIKVMKDACIGRLKDKIAIVFQMLDFDNDGYVCKDDICALLLHVPIS